MIGQPMDKNYWKEWAPRNNEEAAPYIGYVLLVVGMFCYGFHAMMGPVLTTAVVLLTFLTAAVIVGVLERHERKNKSKD